ncbi:MAG TPA: glycosyl hydrolase family 28-related protein, partial [Fimbriimonas sp.]|nr:glycosyl hydrolase family 28-related protein [Fimbriimonas sp.]
RPVFTLGPNTPGFQSGDGKYMIWFTGGRGREDGEIRDANPGTFYSALSNIDIEIQHGNPAAVGIRSHWAQHCFIAHVDFRIGSGRAGIEEVGNESEDLRFFGGEYGIITTKPSPSWPYALVDAEFTGQRVAAIRTEEGGLTLIRNHFSNSPTAISINENRAEELWMKDCRMENISGPALIINDLKSARTEINLQNVACNSVPTLAKFREGGSEIAGAGQAYVVKHFTHGLHISDLGAIPEVKSTLETAKVSAMPEAVASDIPSLPPTDSWVDITSLGAKGDGTTDNTEIIRDAIAKHKTLYFPTGRYVVRDRIALKSDTVLIGLNPITTQLALNDSTPGYQLEKDALGPKPLLEAPPGGRNIVTGLVLDTGGINPRAVACKWQAGSNSYMNDVKFYGGHGSVNLAFLPQPEPRPDARAGIYNNNHTADADIRRKWDSQYPSLWVTNGGGGTFKDIWTASTFAQAGMAVSDTATEGRVYAMSSEHHVRNEIKFTRASNWQVYALQMEEERGEGPAVLPLSIEDCSNLTFGNLYIYRVMSTYSPYPYGVKIRRSHDLRFFNVHTYGPSKFTVDDTVADLSTGLHSRSREIASLYVSGEGGKPHLTAGVEKLAGGFSNIDNLATDAEGNVYFVDARWQSIYRWMPATHELQLLRDNALSPVGLTVDKSGNVIILTSTGSVYSFKPGSSDDLITMLDAKPLSSHPDGIAVLPTTRWRDSHDFLSANQKPAPWEYVSPDGSLFIPATNDFKNAGPNSSIFSTIDLIRAYQLTQARPGATVYIGDEFGQKTYSFKVSPDGSLSDPRVIAEEGEAGVATDSHGNVYVCAGDIFVHDPSGKHINRIELPERPTSIVFGGADGKTLFIGARSSLYSIRMR